MTVQIAPEATPIAAPVSLWARTTPPSWPWRRGALLLSGAAQLITIAALVSVDPLAATWWSLLLAIAPIPLAVVAAAAPVPVARLGALAAIVVMIAGIIGGISHTGLFFAPALIVMAGAAFKLSRETA
jgi:hypothetical protein